VSRILLLVPHPDDEVVAAAATIGRARAAGDEFFGLYLTSGVPAPEALWRWDKPRRAARVARRRDEAMAAAAILGIVPVGFSDWPSRTLKSHLDEALRRIEEAIEREAIDTLWVSAWEGGHQDHDAANFLAAHVGAGRPVVEFAEYNAGGGRARRQRFAMPNGSETVVELTPAEAMLKRRLLALYRSERANLGGVRVDVESRRPLPRYDYGRPPHDGRLSRETFQWVGRLVRHPRVDHEPSRLVYQKLRAFRDGLQSAEKARSTSRLRPI
jgi:N-acetylglucosamine malate deacetylase 1